MTLAIIRMVCSGIPRRVGTLCWQVRLQIRGRVYTLYWQQRGLSILDVALSSHNHKITGPTAASVYKPSTVRNRRVGVDTRGLEGRQKYEQKPGVDEETDGKVIDLVIDSHPDLG